MSESSKKTVKYHPKDSFVELGKRAFVTPVDHPNCSNTGPVITTEVMVIFEDGFETRNTRYVQV